MLCYNNHIAGIGMSITAIKHIEKYQSLGYEVMIKYCTEEDIDSLYLKKVLSID